MSATLVPAALRRLVRERASLRCEHCLLSEDDAYFPFEPDHVIAVKHGGTTDASNLALACFDCNRFKGSDIASLDPLTAALTSLFNPRSEVWTSHFQVQSGLIGPTGRVTASILRMNLAARVEVRRELAAVGRWPGLAR